jgi:aminoglycoside phosphotransferase (APT) family kinase protein
MERPWSAEHEVSATLARALIEAQFAELAPARVEVLGVGWDNTAFVVNEAYVFRFPRRQIAVNLIEIENRLLPFVAPRLPLPVPVPLFVGRPEERFPWPFGGYRKLAGRTACALALDERQRIQAAEPIAHFLAALHAIPRDEASRRGAGPDALGRLDVAKLAPLVRQRLEQIARLGLVGDLRPWASVIDATVVTPSPEALVLLHGDLYARHLLVDAGGQLAGVIDWGDVHVGHPAVDLSIAHGFLPPAAHDGFRRAYGPIDDATWRLARFRALHHAAAVVVFAHDIGDGDLLREGLTALHHLALAESATSGVEKALARLQGTGAA